jgi:hypothetical protein
MCPSTSASSRQPRCRASIRTKPTTLLIGPRWCPLSRADTRRTKGKAYVTPGSIQGRVPRLSPGNDPCRHRATSNPNGVGNLHVQLRCMRSYHIQSRRNAVGRTSAKPSKQGPPPSLIGPEWRPVPPSESPGRAGSRLAYTDALSSCGGISTPGREGARAATRRGITGGLARASDPQPQARRQAVRPEARDRWPRSSLGRPRNWPSRLPGLVREAWRVSRPTGGVRRRASLSPQRAVSHALQPFPLGHLPG